MRRNSISKEFTNTMKQLYADTHTRVILNGKISRSFKVQREVRQGDPLSCLLFNIVIESIAQTLWHLKLRCLQINNNIKKIIATISADNTTVYLAESDSFTDLELLLKRWYEASGAHFNIPKTVIIPIDTQEYRNNLLLTRRSNLRDQTVAVP